jgi:hypothetical protein
MIRILITACFTLGLIAACTPALTPTLTPSALPPTPSPTAEPLPLLPTLNPDGLLLEPNEAYYVLITFAESPPARVDIERDEQKLSFDLKTQNPAAETPIFESDEPSSTSWGMPYILYAINRQPGRNIPASRTTEGTLILSGDGRTLAYFLCNEHGGRGQWCYEPNLWLFDLATGEAHTADFGESGLLYVSNLHFSDDGQTLSGNGCLAYDNPYFGYCGREALMTWSVPDGALVDFTA